MSLYHEGSRELHDRFDSRRIADRLEEVTVSETFSDVQRELIDAAPMFWLATADADGFPDVSYKGGLPGFVRVVGESELAFPNDAPRAGHTPPVPDWKRRPEYRDHLPARDLATLGADDPTGEDRA